MGTYRGKYLKSTQSRPFFWVGIGCCLLAGVFLLYVLLFAGSAVRQRQSSRQDTSTYVKAPSQAPTEAAVPEESAPGTDAALPIGSTPTEAPSEAPTEAPTEPPRFPSIDFEGLREKNPDVVAWLRLPAMEGLDYPVVLGQDNAYYTARSWDGTENEHGAIFLDYQNTADFSQVHSILYGHCMKDGTMFQPLGKWEGPEYFAGTDKTLLLFLPTETRVYEIFAVERVNALDSRVYRTDYPPDESWAQALSETLAAAEHSTSPALDQSSRVLTLSTCIGDMDRLVVHAVCREQVPVSQR